MTHRYRPGGWTALVTHDAVALLHPAVSPAVVDELWQLTSEGRRLGAWVEYLAASGLSALPSFAMAETHAQGVRVLVRGEVAATVGERTLSGRDYTTWREEVLPATGQVTLSALDEQAGGTDGWLPVVGGVVRAAGVRVAVDAAVGQAGAAPAEPAAEEDDVELTVARMPALAAAVGTAAGEPAAAQSAPPEPETPVGDAEPEAPVGDAEPEAPVGDAEAAAPGEDPQDESEDDYDFLLWPTEQAAAHRDERQATAAADADLAADAQAEAEPQADDATPDQSPGQPAGRDPAAAAAPDAAEEVAHVSDMEATRAPEPDEDAPVPVQQPGAIIDSVPGRPAPSTGPPPTPPSGPSPAPSSGPPPAPPSGAPVDLPPPDDGDHDGQTVHASQLPHSDVPIAQDAATPAVPTVELVLSSGPRIEMARPVLIGRAPEAARFAGSESPRLVSVPGPDVSATHVEIRPASGHVVVTDMNSTNGTVVHLPDQPAFRLQPGSGVPVGAGAVIEIGADVTIRVETTA